MAKLVRCLGILGISIVLTGCGGANYAPVRDAVPINQSHSTDTSSYTESSVVAAEPTPAPIYSDSFSAHYAEPVIIESTAPETQTQNYAPSEPPALSSAPEKIAPPVTQQQSAPPTTQHTPPATPKAAPAPVVTPPPATVTAPVISPDAGKSKWIWPSSGKVIRGFSAQNKGLDIQGKRGDPVYASAEGKVVYSGTGLRGYGQLVIVKHNAEYVTAYAHNSAVLVEEGDSVKQGQKIAEIGDSGTNTVKLYFELRLKGKPVDPIKYLPKR
jgi:lipoprotein NlpD